MTDYRKIRVAPSYRRLSTRDTAMMCERSQVWLREECSLSRSGPLVIITHHAPSAFSVPEKFSDDILSAAYASNLDQLVESSHAALWIHGHIHTACDYRIGDTRVICNPRGYPDEAGNGFNPSLVIEIQTP